MTAPTHNSRPSTWSTDSRARSLALEEECRNCISDRFPHQKWKEAHERIKELRKRLHDQFVERNDAIDGILAALISRAGCVLLGPPGTAKSMLVRMIAEECQLRSGGDDANYFEYLLTAHTMPEEVFGPTDIAKLLASDPTVERRTHGCLPHAEIAFLDEVFRGGSHILNTLLTILNERKYYNGRTIEEVPLIGFIGAANHPPQTEELQAFFDRFPVRIWVDSVLDNCRSDVMKRALGLLDANCRFGPGANDNSGGDPPTTADFRYLWTAVRAHLCHKTAQDPRLTEFVSNFRRFQPIGKLSDRAFIQLWYFAGALDLLSGGEMEEPYANGGKGHLDCFRYVAPSIEAVREIAYHLEDPKLRANYTGG